MHVLGAHTSLHHNKQAHKASRNDLGKRPNKILLPMMLDQSRTTQQEVPMEVGVWGAHERAYGYNMWLLWMVYERNMDDAQEKKSS